MAANEKLLAMSNVPSFDATTAASRYVSKVKRIVKFMSDDINSIPSDTITTVDELCVEIATTFLDSNVALSKIIEKAERGNALEDDTIQLQTALNDHSPALIADKLVDDSF